MARRFHLPKPKKCPKTRKTKFDRQKQAQYAMGRIIAHTTEDMFDLHTYLCPDCKGWHVGHKSTYEKFVLGATNEESKTQANP